MSQLLYLTDEHGEYEDAGQPVERHEHVLDLRDRLDVVADGGGRFRRQVHAVDVTGIEFTQLDRHSPARHHRGVATGVGWKGGWHRGAAGHLFSVGPIVVFTQKSFVGWKGCR